MKLITRSLIVWSLLALGLGTIQIQAGLFGPKGNDAEEKRETVRKQRDEILKEFFQGKPALKEKLKKAAGYATFKQSDVNLFLLATGNGYGIVVDNKTGKETYMRVISLGGGVGMGVQGLRLLFVFNDPDTMRGFVESGLEFRGKADAAAKYKDTGTSADVGVKSSVDYKQGTMASGAATDLRAGVKEGTEANLAAATGGAMEIYQYTDKGIALQATVQGTKYWKDKKLNE